jgi:hypothetical protein
MPGVQRPTWSVEGDIMKFDYEAAAELFTAKRVGGAKRPLDYRRFARAAEAIRFAIEELADIRKLAAYIQVGNQRLDGDEIRRLYDSKDYPLRRRTGVLQ